MTVSTTSAAVHITPVVFKTFYKHVKTKGLKYKQKEEEALATDDIFFDEAFHIVKSFIELGTKNTVESLQAFTNTHVPAPYWAAVSPVIVPLSCCNKAADTLIEWFGPEELKQIVGGERWWQVRGLDGVDAEWITEKEYLQHDLQVDKNTRPEDATILKMDHLKTVMLYVHGGAYFWGSINTHRYQMIRYARKTKGRVFAVNYRKAPQYPWPCPLQDVLAAYFYLTSPPPGAVHKPILPSNIVIAGDSAGAGLCLAVLTLLRDMGIEQPAGAVLISPWVDLTHSFPSVMQNTPTDIIPPHGFIHKPSPIWPVQSLPREAPARVIPTGTNPPPEPGHADTLRPSKERLGSQVEARMEKSAEKDREVHTRELTDDHVAKQGEMLAQGAGSEQRGSLHGSGGSASSTQDTVRDDDPNYDDALSFYEPKPPKVLMQTSDAVPLELRAQIQLYATNEQLSHPLVSPILQSSLGNLCPLYIIAGDGEVLRDEIMYLAHKAANPKEYPTRKGVIKNGLRQKENMEKFQTPTKVHLQVYDGMCHVLTVFTFTRSARYAYRSIAEFVKYVTLHSAEHLDRNPFPELHIPPPDIDDPPLDVEDRPMHPKTVKHKTSSRFSTLLRPRKNTSPSMTDTTSHRSDIDVYRKNEETAKEEVEMGGAQQEKPDSPGSFTTAGDSGTGSEKVHELAETAKIISETFMQAASSGSSDIAGVDMIRERVDIFGRVRPMEPKEDIQALKLPVREIGIIKEEPVKRWLTGQEEWDKKFKRNALYAERRRQHYEKKLGGILARAREQGLELHIDSNRPSVYRRKSTMSTSPSGEIVRDRRWGPFDLEDEHPPPSAIAGRRDNRESVALFKKCIYFTAPVTHKTVPKRSAAETVRAAFDPDDNLDKPPRQSVSEEQGAAFASLHGLRVWQGILDLFARKSRAKAAKGKRRTEDAVHSKLHDRTDS